MTDNLQQVADDYEQQGYFVMQDYFTHAELSSLREVVLTFHRLWKKDNATFYEQEAFNASLITGSQYLTTDERLVLFNFIASDKLMRLIDATIPNAPAFMNTQLFFNPVSPSQKDFWHRDCQYDHDIESQQKVIKETQVLHLRIPLFDELGIELIPGTHKRWDNAEEFAIRQEENGHESHEGLSQGKKVPLASGDVLVFSADMIHRGLYGLDRLALDILVFDASGDYADYVDDDCLPSAVMLTKIKQPRLFLNTLALKS